MKAKSILLGGLIAFCMAITITSCYKTNSDSNKASINYSESSSNNNGNSYTIKMHTCSHSTPSLTIVKNSKVTWMNDDNIVHSITATDGSFNSGDIAVGSSYSRTFTTAGTINYYDRYNSNINGVIIVSGN